MTYSTMKEISKEQMFLDLIEKKASPEAKERIRNGIKTPLSDSFFESGTGSRVTMFRDDNGQDMVFEEDLKMIEPETAIKGWEMQLKTYGMEAYKDAGFDNINTYKFFKEVEKIPKSIMGIFKDRPICYFHGGPGTGKTTLACAIGRDYAKDGNSVLIRRWSNWLQQLRETFDQSSRDIISHHMVQAQNAKMLILDEIGTDKKKSATEFEIEQLSRIISDRYGNGKPLVITSNLDPKQIENVYGYQISSRIQYIEKSFLQRFDGEIDRRKTPRRKISEQKRLGNF